MEQIILIMCVLSFLIGFFLFRPKKITRKWTVEDDLKIQKQLEEYKAEISKKFAKNNDNLKSRSDIYRIIILDSTNNF